MLLILWTSNTHWTYLDLRASDPDPSISSFLFLSDILLAPKHVDMILRMRMRKPSRMLIIHARKIIARMTSVIWQGLPISTVLRTPPVHWWAWSCMPQGSSCIEASVASRGSGSHPWREMTETLPSSHPPASYDTAQMLLPPDNKYEKHSRKCYIKNFLQNGIWNLVLTN